MSGLADGDASISAVSWWTPERGGLESDDSVRGLRRWTRVLVSVLEDGPAELPERACVVIATRTGHGDLEQDLPALRSRWPSWVFVAVQAGDETVPASLVDAIGNLDRFDAVSCATVELTPAAELGVALWLDRGPAGCRLRVERDRAAVRDAAGDAMRGALNPCAPALELARGIEAAGVSIRVGTWGIHVSSPVPYR